MTQRMRHSRALLGVVSSLLLFVAACVTSHDLSSKPDTGKQPVVTSRGIATEGSADILIARVAGDTTPTDRASIDRLVDAVRESLSEPLVAGNTIVTLVDGPATFAAIDAAIADAEQHVHVETYIFADDALGQSFAQALINKRKQGVEVRLIYDAVGSFTTPNDFFTPMRDAGVEVIAFRPLNPVKTLFWRFHNRDHRKIIVVDGRIAFTGGVNISSTYTSSSSSKPGPEAGLKDGWRDTHVQIAGPSVHQFQALFLDTWRELDGKLTQPITHYYPEIKPQGDHLVSAVASKSRKQKDEAIYQTYLAAIRNSSERVWITQAYFSPPKELRNALIDAVQRGIDVRIIVPGFTDSTLILNASRNEYDKLLKGGVRLIETRKALLHAKTALIDDSLTIVGSANLDYRSFLHNNEVTAIIVGDDTGKRMYKIFVDDLAQGKELTLKDWNKRPVLDRAKESLSSLVKFWL